MASVTVGHRINWFLVTASAVLFAGLTPLPAFQGQGTERVDVLIRFQSAAGTGDEALVRALGGQVRYRYRIVPGIAATLPQAAVNALANNPRVAAVEPDGLVFAVDVASELAGTWGVNHINAGDVHPTNVGAGVKVGILDSGIDAAHAELTANFVGGHDFVNGDTNPFDDNGHGTHVAGTVAGVRDGSGVVGVAPSASLFAYKVLNASGSGGWSGIIAALERAVDDGVQVTNNSYGSSGYPGSLVEDAFAASAAAGILHIASAGNAGACNGRRDNVGYPARFDTVVAVAATNSSDGRACFSSTGPDVELSAPGVGILSSVPGGGYEAWNGTSMASPHVAGTAALMFAADGTLTADEVRQLLAATAVDLGDTGRDSLYGFGRIDAFAAVEAAGSGGGGGGGGGGGDPDPPADVVVGAVNYSMTGGRSNDKHLLVAVTITDGSAPIGGATVSVAISRGGSIVANGTGVTGTNGQVTFEIKNAPSGCYTTQVTAVTVSGSTSTPLTPANQFCR